MRIRFGLILKITERTKSYIPPNYNSSQNTRIHKRNYNSSWGLSPDSPARNASASKDSIHGVRRARHNRDGRRPGLEIGLYASVARNGTGILRRHLVALPVLRIKRPQLFAQRGIVLCPERTALAHCTVKLHRGGGAEQRTCTYESFSRHHHSPEGWGWGFVPTASPMTGKPSRPKRTR